MKVSINEVERLVEKAARGMGAFPGADTDAGLIVAWLAVHGLPGVALAARDLADTAEIIDCGALTISGGPGRWQVDAGGRSLLLIAGTLLDLAVADAARAADSVGRIQVSSARSPLFLIPVAVQAAEPDRAFSFESTNRLARIRVAVAGDGPRVEWRATADLTGTDPTDITIVYGPVPDGSDRLAAGLSADDLAGQEKNAFATGVLVEEGPWAVLGNLTARTLVPASETSRRRGAGAEVDDNE